MNGPEILDIYIKARADKHIPWHAAQITWDAVRGNNDYIEWSEQICLDIGSRVGYECPLACVLYEVGVDVGICVIPYGHHSRHRPRPAWSHKLGAAVAARLLNILESHLPSSR